MATIPLHFDDTVQAGKTEAAAAAACAEHGGVKK
jgi:hypothetical protein